MLAPADFKTGNIKKRIKYLLKLFIATRFFVFKATMLSIFPAIAQLLPYESLVIIQGYFANLV